MVVGDSFFFPAAPAASAAWWPQEAAPVTRKRAGVPKAKKGVGPGRTQNQTAKFWFSGLNPQQWKADFVEF